MKTAAQHLSSFVHPKPTVSYALYLPTNLSTFFSLECPQSIVWDMFSFLQLQTAATDRYGRRRMLGSSMDKEGKSNLLLLYVYTYGTV